MKHFSNYLLKSQNLIRDTFKFSFAKKNIMSQSEMLDPQQELLLQEKCILVDKNDKNIGVASKKECHLIGVDGTPPPLHRAFSVFLFNSQHQLLLQQRSSFKITFPLFYTNTCCSHPLAIEEEMDEENAMGIKVAARRRLSFELGIPTSEVDLSELKYLTRIHYASPSLDGKWGEHEIDYILILKKDLTIRPNLNEIKEINFVGKDEFDLFMKKLEIDKVSITPWFKLIVSKFLPVWWENLNNLDQFVDHKSIHRM